MSLASVLLVPAAAVRCQLPLKARTQLQAVPGCYCNSWVQDGSSSSTHGRPRMSPRHHEWEHLCPESTGRPRWKPLQKLMDKGEKFLSRRSG